MSEESREAVMDETPPPDIVERPARSSGAYKLCMECGQNRDRRRYRAGSSVCESCEARAQTPVVLEDARSEAGNEAVAEAVRQEALPDETVSGLAGSVAWLTRLCGVPGDAPLTLETIAEQFQTLKDAQVQMIGRVTRQRGLMGEVRPEDVPLETAAQTLYLACDPILQEALSAAMELLGLSLNQVMLGNLAFSRQELLNQDQSLVPQASLAVQFGPRRGLLTRVPGGRLLDQSGQLVRTCLCCGREFHPPRDRPNPDFCDDFCGTFADQLRIWATNTVLDELRYPGSTTPAPQPDPRTFWEVERCQEPYVSHALQFRETRIAQQMQAARLQQQKMRGI